MLTFTSKTCEYCKVKYAHLLLSIAKGNTLTLLSPAFSQKECLPAAAGVSICHSPWEDCCTPLNTWHKNRIWANRLHLWHLSQQECSAFPSSSAAPLRSQDCINVMLDSADLIHWVVKDLRCKLK